MTTNSESLTAGIEIVDDFIASDYALQYTCAAECAPGTQITDDGVWFRPGPAGLLRSAHRRCLQRSGTHSHA